MPDRAICVLRIIPGLLVAGVVAGGAVVLAEFLGTDVLGFDRSPVSSVMPALVIGLLIANSWKPPAILEPGLSFAVKRVLRAGVVLLGFRLSVVEVVRVGAGALPLVLACVAFGLFAVVWAAARTGISRRLGMLIGVGTSICGVSAVVATAPGIGARDEEVSYAVAVITIFGLIATIVYPFLAYAVFPGPTSVGLFLGTSIHDTSQVTAAALVHAETYAEPAALDVAVVTKLVRNTLMGAVIPAISLWASTRGLTPAPAARAAESSHPRTASPGSNAGPGTITRAYRCVTRVVPLFVLGFLALSAVRSLGDIGITGESGAFGVVPQQQWLDLGHVLNEIAVAFLVAALAAVGMKTRFAGLRQLGLKPFLLGLVAALCVGGLSAALILSFI